MHYLMLYVIPPRGQRCWQVEDPSAVHVIKYNADGPGVQEDPSAGHVTDYNADGPGAHVPRGQVAGMRSLQVDA